MSKHSLQKVARKAIKINTFDPETSDDIATYEKEFDAQLIEKLNAISICPHSLLISECEACYITSDLAFDANRERKS